MTEQHFYCPLPLSCKGRRQECTQPVMLCITAKYIPTVTLGRQNHSLNVTRLKGWGCNATVCNACGYGAGF